jgi:hypothetical protein
MGYELWDTDTGNLVETFDSEVDALLATREWIGANASVYPVALTLLRVEEDGSLTTVVEGEALAALA